MAASAVSEGDDAGFCFRSPSPEATRAAGRRLGACLAKRPLAVALSGALGAGKTSLVKGIAEGLGIDPRTVASPTFVIASEYEGTGGRRLVHADAYRVESVAEMESAGLLDALAASNVVAIEWAERCAAMLPDDRLEISLARDRADPEARMLTLHARGPTARALLAEWSALQSEAQGGEGWR